MACRAGRGWHRALHLTPRERAAVLVPVSLGWQQVSRTRKRPCRCRLTMSPRWRHSSNRLADLCHSRRARSPTGEAWTTWFDGPGEPTDVTRVRILHVRYAVWFTAALAAPQLGRGPCGATAKKRLLRDASESPMETKSGNPGPGSGRSSRSCIGRFRRDPPPLVRKAHR